jgi:hypothetical protein
MRLKQQHRSRQPTDSTFSLEMNVVMLLLSVSFWEMKFVIIVCEHRM